MSVNREFFKYEHLPKHLAEISEPFHIVMTVMDAELIPSAEKEVVMRKLLEAKDAAVRAKLEETM